MSHQKAGLSSPLTFLRSEACRATSFRHQSANRWRTQLNALSIAQRLSPRVDSKSACKIVRIRLGSKLDHSQIINSRRNIHLGAIAAHEQLLGVEGSSHIGTRHPPRLKKISLRRIDRA